MSGYCVSKFAFADHLTKDDEKSLFSAYRSGGLQRFHYMNAATLPNGTFETFFSYYTAIGRLNYSWVHEWEILTVYPFIYDTDSFVNSRTTNKQFNKWLYEHGILTTVNDIRNAYNLISDDKVAPPIFMDNKRPVVLKFAGRQHYLSSNGVPFIDETYSLKCIHTTYDESDALVRI